MKRNPVFDREMRVSSRSARLPMILGLFNGTLFLVTLLNLYSVMLQVETSAAIQYGSFMEMYGFVTAIEFLLLLILAPAMTSGAISAEREKQTLELMLTTKMKPRDIVAGKLMSSMATLLLLLLSSVPAVAMVFIYGGITWLDAFLLILCYVTTAFFAGSLGICCSAIFRRSTVSAVVTYVSLMMAVGGTYFLNKFSLSLSSMSTSLGSAYEAGEAAVSSGPMFGLFLLNPAVTFLAIVGEQGGRSFPFSRFCSRFGVDYRSFFMEHWVWFSILLQLLAGILLLKIAARYVEPVKRNQKHSHFQKKGIE